MKREENKNMTGWVFVFGVDGFGADTAPAHEQGVYLNFDKAFTKLCELNFEQLELFDAEFYEDGYTKYEYPDDDLELKAAEDAEDWDLFNELMEKHKLTKIEDICMERCVNPEEPPYNFYALEEIEIIE